MSDRSIQRPTTVTIIAVLLWISGALGITSGIILMFQSNDESVVEGLGGTGALYSAAVSSIIVGVIEVVLALGLLRGNAAARMIITVLEVLSIIGSLFLAIAYLGVAVGEWLGIVISIVVLLLLWSRRSSAFFTS